MGQEPISAATATDFPNARRGRPYARAVRWWLIAGLVMVIGQVVIGGVTRLTESGLSITEWKPLSGAVPPLNAADWDIEFEKYRESPQYAQIFADISMEDFKFIYFWEWFHRQWARMMGLVFVVGFVFFRWKKQIDGPLARRLGVVVFLAALAASFGWIMVASGLIDRPWVNAYKLAIHLSLGITLFAYLLWVTLQASLPTLRGFSPKNVENLRWPVNIVLAIQLFLGGIMSGAKAALPYPTWPDMNGRVVPTVLLDGSAWTMKNMIYYEQSLFQPALIQFLHRGTAYLLFIIGLWFSYRAYTRVKNVRFRWGAVLLAGTLTTQVLLGIATVVSSIGQVPVGLGVAHQFTAIALVGVVVYLNYLLSPGRTLRPEV